MSPPTSLLELAGLGDMGETGRALLAVVGVLVFVAVLVKGLCFVLEAMRGEGGICGRSDFGIKGGGISDPGAAKRARKASKGKPGLC